MLQLLAWRGSRPGPGGQAQAAKLAIVNSRMFHLEVLAGVLEVVRPLAPDTAVFVHPKVLGRRRDGQRSLFGFRDLVSDYPGPLYRLPMAASAVGRHQLAVFVSPE